MGALSQMSRPLDPIPEVITGGATARKIKKKN
jgi:hypothetical protein